ncbi:MAG: exodeoxyribonuclease VII large subunit [Candidatus Binatia bacterium]|nr:exodeoxyribonuclease VII large subunit [Candidatus Binatia bacterium]
MSTQRGLDFGPRAKPAASAPSPESAPEKARRSIPVRRFVQQLKTGLQEVFPNRFWLEGEVSGYKVIRNGHAFFSLKEAKDTVEAVMWADQRARLAFTPEDGSQVLALVRRVDYYGPSGRLRLQVDDLEPHGVGALQKALEERKARLLKEGLFEDARKLPLPALPRVVGIVTAPKSAALKDILEILQQRFAERRMLVRPCRVQGQGAAEDIAAALDDLNRDGTADVIILGRGGGSMEDLWCFNEEAVVRAIARSRIPVIAGVGHEVDTTLADYAADLRVATPTAAAQRCLPDRREIEARLEEHDGRLRNAVAKRVELARARLRLCDAALADPRSIVSERRLRLEALASRSRQALVSLTPDQRGRLDGFAARARQALVALTPARRIRLERAMGGLRARLPRTDLHMENLGQLGPRLETAMLTSLSKARADLGARASQVNALSPLAVLGRGFAVPRRDDGAIVRDAASLTSGDALHLRFARGSARTRVEEVEALSDAMDSTAGPADEEET